jgi:hypothetical protein
MEQVEPKNRTSEFILICLLLLVLVGGFGLWRSMVNKHKAELAQANNYKNALTTQMKVYKDANGNIWAEHLTLQVSLNQLRADTARLNSEKRELLHRIMETQHGKAVIAAALIKTKVKTRVIYVPKPTDTTDSTVTFVSKTDSISFKATVANVYTIPTRTPSFRLDSLSLDNKTYVNFKWGAKKEGYPVSFSVTNSNPLFKTVNIESYAIPELSKTELRPTFFQKLGTGISTHGVVFGVGAIIGFGTGVYLLHR